uniref:Uncharacterized protein n=1 Tax=Photinus pyralis TaxID=7054 RepID=A0A1Y1LRG1_PHOPY
MALVDNTRQITVLGALGHECAVLLVYFGNELIQDGTLNENIIVRQAHLASVEALLPEKTPGGELDIAILGNEGRVLATKFEKNGCERLGSLGCDDGTSLLATGKDNLVELVLHDMLCLLQGTVDTYIAIRVEVLVKYLLENHGRVRRQLRGLEHDTVASGNGANDGSEIQLKGEVVSTNDEHLAQRLVSYARAHWPVSHGQVDDVFILGPGLELVGDIDGLVLDPVNLGDVSLKLAFSHVLHDSLLNELLIVRDSPVELADLLQPKVHVLGLVGAKGLAQTLDVGSDAVKGSGLKGRNGASLDVSHDEGCPADSLWRRRCKTAK